MKAVLPPMPRPPKDASPETRERMFREYCDLLDRANPRAPGFGALASVVVACALAACVMATGAVLVKVLQ